MAWWLIPTFLKSFTQLSFDELQAPIWNTASKLKDLQTYWALRNHSKKSLIEANRDLARLNASYELTLSENATLKEEITRMEALLSLHKETEGAYILARISRRDLSSWSHYATIQKGIKDGIIDGAAVIYGNGVVGRIKTAHANSSVIELISSPTFRVAARFRGDTRPITFQGTTNPAFTNPIGRAYNIPTDIEASPEKPLHLVSSRLGGIFPDGLNIGTISKLKPGTEGLFQRAKVQLNNDLHAIQEVVVLLPAAN